MKNYLTLLFALLLFSTMAQTTKEKNIYDSITHQYAQEGIWDSVIDIAKESIYKGYDFYELRMRLAHAYEIDGNYRLAEKNYSKALSQNPDDVPAAEKMFLMAQKGDRNYVASKKYSSFNQEQKMAISSLLKIEGVEEELPINYLQHLKASYSYSFTNNKQENLFPEANTILSADGRVREHQSLAQLQLGGQLSHYINWEFAYNYKQIDGYQLFESRNRPAQQGEFQIAQNELLGEFGFYSGDGWNVKLNAMYAHQNTDYTHYKIDSIGYIIPSDTEDSILIDDLFISSENKSESQDDFVFSLSINRKVSIIDFSIFASYARVNTENPFQLGGEFTILPNGNYHLYLTNQLFWFHDDNNDRAIYKVIVGGDLYKKIGFKASATFGNIQNTKDPNEPMFYNLTEATKYIGNLALCYQFNNRLNLSLRYQILQKNGDFELYTFKGVESNSEYPGYYNAIYRKNEASYTFTEHQIFLGLNWEF